MASEESRAGAFSEAPQPTRRWQIAWAFTAALALLVAIVGYGLVQDRRAAAAREFTTSTLALHESTLAMERLVVLMEVHQRGFLLTGDRRSLRERDAAFEEGLKRVDVLAAHVAGDTRRSRWARDARDSLRSRYAYMRAASDAVARQGLDAGRAAFRAHGEGSVDPILSALHSLRLEHERLLGERTRQADEHARRFRNVLVYGTGLALVLLSMAAVLLYRQLRRNEQLGRELQQANREQVAKSAELERSNRDLESFSYSISHDLRAPLRHVDGYARMLQEDAGDTLAPELRRYLDMISDSARRMGALIDDLLAFSRLGRKPLERTTVDMNQLVADALREAGAASARAHVQVSDLPTAWADPTLMRQAWVNLGSNAIKYSAPKGDDARIEITGERDGALVRYRIRDNGVGFDMRYADKLFGVFQRLHLQDEFEGTGVGLAIVKQIVERHGGRVSAEASPGAGACFTIEIPSGEVA